MCFVASLTTCGHLVLCVVFVFALLLMAGVVDGTQDAIAILRANSCPFMARFFRILCFVCWVFVFLFLWCWFGLCFALLALGLINGLSTGPNRPLLWLVI